MLTTITLMLILLIFGSLLSTVVITRSLYLYNVLPTLHSVNQDALKEFNDFNVFIKVFALTLVTPLVFVWNIAPIYLIRATKIVLPIIGDIFVVFKTLLLACLKLVLLDMLLLTIKILWNILSGLFHIIKWIIVTIQATSLINLIGRVIKQSLLWVFEQLSKIKTWLSYNLYNIYYVTREKIWSFMPSFTGVINQIIIASWLSVVNMAMVTWAALSAMFN